MAARAVKTDEIIQIATTAIQNIQNIVGRSTGTLNTSNSTDTPQPPVINTPPSSRQLTAVQELRQRFPTVASSNSRRNTNQISRPAPYSRRAGRPLHSSSVSKDVIVIEYEQDKAPSRTEKIELEKGKRVISGFEVHREWNAVVLEKELGALLKGTPMEGYSFEIMKNCSGTLVTPNIPAFRRVDAKLLLKSIAPSGAIYIRLLASLPDDDDDGDDGLSNSPFSDPVLVDLAAIQETIQAVDGSDPSAWSTDPPPPSPPHGAPSLSGDASMNICPFDINSVVKKGKELKLSDPVEIVQFLRQEINEGRKLDLHSLTETLEGDTNYITINRGNILQSTFSELEFIVNYRVTFQVDFMGEESVDLGGPRKEWLRCVIRSIKAKYFDNGLREFLSKDYYYIGIIIAVAILQNGCLPTFLGEEILQKVLSFNIPDACVHGIQRGLEQLGLLTALREFPILVYLLRPGAQHQVTVQSLLQLLKPNFSEEGSSAVIYEKSVYQLFVRYVREVASGRRVSGDTQLELEHILGFVTCASEEPLTGFEMAPSIQFRQASEFVVKKQTEEAVVVGVYTPTAHTCGNILYLPRPTHKLSLLPAERLFSIYDLAFSQPFFGVA